MRRSDSGGVVGRGAAVPSIKSTKSKKSQLWVFLTCPKIWGVCGWINFGDAGGRSFSHKLQLGGKPFQPQCLSWSRLAEWVHAVIANGTPFTGGTPVTSQRAERPGNIILTYNTDARQSHKAFSKDAHRHHHASCAPIPFLPSAELTQPAGWTLLLHPDSRSRPSSSCH
jgi:hypothetical protein